MWTQCGTLGRSVDKDQNDRKLAAPVRVTGHPGGTSARIDCLQRPEFLRITDRYGTRTCDLQALRW